MHILRLKVSDELLVEVERLRCGRFVLTKYNEVVLF